MAKTIVVEVSRRVPHPLYRRVVTRKKKFYAHDEKGQAHLGDRVQITECRPLSKLKRWRLTDVIWQAAQIEIAATPEPTETAAPPRKRRKKS
jgi:small subunit ribosomal protein S17